MFTFKGETSKDNGLIVREVASAILPTVNEKTVEIPSRHGGLDYGRTYGMRQIDFTVGIKGESDEDLRLKMRRLAKWLNSRTLQPLVLSDEPDKQYMARVTGDTNLSPLFRYEEATVSFLVPDPFAEDIQSTAVTIPGGETTPINVAGTAETFPVFTVTMDAAAEYFEISRSSEEEPDDDLLVKVVTVLTPGDVLVIDCTDGKITLNGTLVQTTMTLDSDFIYLTEGENRLTCSPGGTVEVKYKNKWL
ncbi:phage tail family protein [Bacillus haynesii]|uniref:distal tail protein Dit n=1 Tax=Bacillus haynesii TaxID=1925021 RepID=UPI00227ED2FD|nr:distal tail protein Dit [Bacillus haynesii]MCY8048443.1 phage tail family protein [Bacillus haynesii]